MIFKCAGLLVAPLCYITIQKDQQYIPQFIHFDIQAIRIPIFTFFVAFKIMIVFVSFLVRNSRFGLNKPNVIGEFSQDGGNGTRIEDMFEFAYNNGYRLLFYNLYIYIASCHMHV